MKRPRLIALLVLVATVAVLVPFADTVWLWIVYDAKGGHVVEWLGIPQEETWGDAAVSPRVAFVLTDRQLENAWDRTPQDWDSLKFDGRTFRTRPMWVKRVSWLPGKTHRFPNESTCGHCLDGIHGKCREFYRALVYSRSYGDLSDRPCTCAHPSHEGAK